MYVWRESQGSWHIYSTYIYIYILEYREQPVICDVCICMLAYVAVIMRHTAREEGGVISMITVLRLERYVTGQAALHKE